MGQAQKLAEEYGDKIQDAVKTGKSDGYISKLESFATKPTTVKQLTETIHSIDQTSAMKGFRRHWNKLPKAVQWLAMHSTSGSMISSFSPFKTLIKFGFIEYKGHQDENGKVIEAEIAAMGGFEKIALKYGVMVGKYFIPELKAVEPFVEPLLKIENIKDNLLAKTRQNVRALREEAEAPRKNISAISKSTKLQIHEIHLPN